ncbi:hypothetical protein [Halobacillus litoralis]|nr:hypothetical protein [Halobacillus litoralis]MCA1021084.1 hypothetical protein [Halobacillus litoralis]
MRHEKKLVERHGVSLQAESSAAARLFLVSKHKSQLSTLDKYIWICMKS